MKIKEFIGLFLLIIALKVSSQNQHVDLMLKEDYDWHLGTQFPITSLTSADNASSTGENYSFLVESGIRMFETTNDKAYLIKCINIIIAILEKRQDYVAGGSGNPQWTTDNASLYRDGQACKALAHFVYLIQNKYPNSIANLTISQKAPNSFPNTKLNGSNNLFGIDFSSYSYLQFSNWLSARVYESLEYLISHHYGADYLCFIQQDLVQDPIISDRAMQINQQAAFGAALFYMGNLNNGLPQTSDYNHKFQVMASLYKGTYVKGNADYAIFDIPYPYPPLPGNDALDAYAWHQNGWREILPNEPIGSVGYEDVGHGVWGMCLPYAIYHELGPNNSYFNQQWMTRIRNTLTNNLYAGYSGSCPYLHAGVAGQDIIEQDNTHSLGGSNYVPEYILGWAPFYQFDNYSSFTPYGHSAYDLIMDYYRCFYNTSSNTTSNIPGVNGTILNGIAELIAGQWDLECVNLTLYNRDLVYNQDFSVKNILTFDPTFAFNGNPNSFADPIIPNPTFVIESGITSNITAGEKIVFKDGFKAAVGCTIKASITGSSCTDGQRMANTNPAPSTFSSQLIAPVENNNTQSALCKLYPNPSSGRLFVSGKGLDGASIMITSMIGDVVFKSQSFPTEGMDISGLTDGTYICAITFRDGSFKKEKLVILK